MQVNPLDRFNVWFSSAAGVVQTAIVALGLAAYEIADRSFDPHGFWLLWALTVYSAVTQPALAYSGVTASRKLDVTIRRIEALENQNSALLERIDALLEDAECPTRR
jgi:hypothetical protein